MLIHNNLIKEDESAHGASVGVISYISCLFLADGVEILEKKVLGCSRDVIPMCLDKFEVLTVFRNEYVHFFRHEDSRTFKLHE